MYKYIQATCLGGLRPKHAEKWTANLKLVEEINQGTPTDEIGFEPFAHQHTKRNEPSWGYKNM